MALLPISRMLLFPGAYSISEARGNLLGFTGGFAPRPQDLFRVNLHLTFTFSNLTAHEIPPKHLYLRVSPLSFG
jgi:hypothetical protein